MWIMLYIVIMFCSLPIQAAQEMVVDIEHFESSLVPEDSMSHAIAQLIYSDKSSIEYESLVKALTDENIEKSQLGAQFYMRNYEEGDGKLRKASRIMARLVVKMHRDNEELQKHADYQNTKIEKHKTRAVQGEKKSFWSILTAVGSAALAVASTTWGAIEATGTAPLIVSVVCNCTNATI